MGVTDLSDKAASSGIRRDDSVGDGFGDEADTERTKDETRGAIEPAART
jgi:hypothetical protein